MELSELLTNGRTRFEAFHSQFSPLFGRSEMVQEQAVKYLQGLDYRHG